jgi:hypothetical protein
MSRAISASRCSITVSFGICVSFLYHILARYADLRWRGSGKTTASVGNQAKITSTPAEYVRLPTISIMLLISIPLVIALSADCQESTKHLCLSAGMDAFFSKPLKKSQ